MEQLTHLLPAGLTDQLTLGWGAVQGEYGADMLSGQERDEWRSYKSPVRRREYLATRHLLRATAKQMQLHPDDFQLDKDELGKPFGRYRGREYHVSIAHTDHRVLCAISPALALGVDLEPAARVVPDRLRARILAEGERALLEGEPTLRIWTLKEALVKLEGRGMRTNLNECVITGTDEALFSARLSDDKRAKICSFQHQEHWLALAWHT